MGFYLLVYYSSGETLRSDQVESNRQAWRSWNASLNETYGIKTSHGAVVRADGVSDYHGDLRGASIIEAASFDDATRIARRSPSVAFGGRVEVFEEF